MGITFHSYLLLPSENAVYCIDSSSAEENEIIDYIDEEPLAKKNKSGSSTELPVMITAERTRSSKKKIILLKFYPQMQRMKAFGFIKMPGFI